MNERKEIKQLKRILFKKNRKINNLQSKIDIDWRRQFYFVALGSGVGFVIVLIIQLLH